MVDVLEALITHLVMGAIAIVIFSYIVITATDPTMFFMRHYGQDAGLITEALHGANGDVELRYLSIYPDHLYWFDFTKNALLIGSPQPLDNLFFARIRKQYGVVSDDVPRPLGVNESMLKSPSSIDFLKNSREISVDGTFTRCSEAYDSIEEGSLVLIVDAPKEVLDRILDIPSLAALLWDGVIDELSEDDIESFSEGLLTSSTEEILDERGVDISRVRRYLEEENKDVRTFLLSQEFKKEKNELLFVSIKEGSARVAYSPKAKGVSCLLSMYLENDSPGIVQQQSELSDFMELEVSLSELRDAQALSIARALSLTVEGLVR